METFDYLAFARRYWHLLVALPLAAGLVAFIVSHVVSPTYSATATVLVLNVGSVDASPDVIPVDPGGQEGAAAPGPDLAPLNDLLVEERLMATYVELVKQRPVLDAAIRGLGLSVSPDQLDGRLAATNPEDTQLIRITAQDANQDRAAGVANAVAQAFMNRVTEDTGRSGTILVTEEAIRPASPSAPNIRMNVVIALLLGLLLAVAAGLAETRFGISKYVSPIEIPRVRRPTGLLASIWPAGRSDASAASAAAIEAASGLEIVGIVSEQDSPWSEAGQQLRESLVDRGLDQKPATILVTSANEGEGKSFTAANLAIALSLHGDRVVLIDANRRRPSLHKIFDVPAQPGLSEAIAGDTKRVTPFIQTSFSSLRLLVIGAGNKENGGFPRQRMLDLLERTRDTTDYIVVDSAALADDDLASFLAQIADATLMVVQADKTSTTQLRDLVQDLRRKNVRVVGAVVNRLPTLTTA